MNPGVVTLFALVFLIRFQGSVSGLGGNCMADLFQCFMNGTTVEEFRNRQTSCCEKLLSNVTYSFTETFDGCVEDDYEDLARECLNAVGPICKLLITRKIMKNLEAYEDFGKRAVESVQPPADVQDCGRFVADYEAEKVNLCQANIKEFKHLKEMCDAILKASRK